MRELGNLFNMSASSAQPVKHSLEVCTILHRNDSELVFFIDPDKESLVLVVEDASSVRPVSVKTNCLKESVALLKEEVIVNQLLSLGLSHVVEGIVSTSEVASETLQGLHNILLNLYSLLICNSWSKRETLEIAAHSDSGTFDHCGIFSSERRSNKL